MDGATVRAMLMQHFESSDPDLAHAMYHDDAVLEFPQSGERFVGRESFREWRSTYPRVHWNLHLDVETPLVLVDMAEVVVSSTERLAWIGEDTHEHQLAMTNATSNYSSFVSQEFVVAAEGGASASGVVSAGTNNFGRSRSCLFGGHVALDP